MLDEEERQAIQNLKYMRNATTHVHTPVPIERVNMFISEEIPLFEDKYIITIDTILNLVDKQNKLIEQMKEFILDKKLMYEFLDMAKESKTNE